MRKIDPLGPEKCPERYEYVHGYKDKSGTYVKPFCRRITRKRLRLNIKVNVNYPGDTKIKFSAREGIHHTGEKLTVPTQSLFSENQLENLLTPKNPDEKKKT